MSLRRWYAAGRGATLRLGAPFVAQWVMLGLVLVLVLYPVLLIVLNSFQTGRPGQAGALSLDAWRLALSDPGMLSATWNTIALTLARQAIAIPTSIGLAWVLARTDIPASEWLEFLFWIAFFLPALPVTLGWIMLLQPEHGLVNQWLAGLPFVGSGPFNIYSFWGIVWAHLASGTIAVEVMLLTPAFRNLDATLEDAARVSGAGSLATLVGVVVPVLTPVMVVVLLLSIIHSLQAFEIELILGFPIRLFVFSTQIYSLIRQDPPLFPAAMALSSVILGLMLPLIVLQRWVTTRRSYTTVSGQFKAHKLQLRAWRVPIFFLVLGVGLAITVLPVTFLLITTFMKLFGFFNLPQPWTTAHWSQVTGDSIFLTSVRTTVLLAGGTALAAVALFTGIAYVIVRTRFVGRAALDFVSWLPSTLPGIILGLGLLWLFLGSPILQPLYGTLVLLIVVTAIASMTLGVQIIKSSLAQLSPELEDAARMSGASWWRSSRHVLLPLITPTLLLVGAVSFISAARSVSTVALLATSSTRPLSLLQLDFMVEGRYEAAAVVGVIIVAITTAVALLARVLGLRVGLG
ncbi:MAG TPA: iron ABC transporter permease [Chloroflexota bacterium]|nr:iron ABC transporter permease [Chloroflexota bacterium]